MGHTTKTMTTGLVHLVNPDATSCVVLVCEHASAMIPPCFDNLGLAEQDLQSHAAWDPGAMGVAQAISKRLDAALVAGAVSRLVYDCNRPPSSPDATPERSEVIDVPGNSGLTEAQRQARAQTYYAPFREALAAQIAKTPQPVIVTIHSFTPIYHGVARQVEYGVLHDSDTRLADAMLQTAAQHTSAIVQRNDPYGPEHGVTHTLEVHALPKGYLNVMLEIRNDLIRTAEAQEAAGDMIAAWLVDALAAIGTKGHVQCAV